MSQHLVRARRPQIRVSNFPLYDTVKIGGSTSVSSTTYRLFQNGEGANADGFTSKTIAETNLSRQGGLPLGQSYSISSLGVAIFQADVSSHVGSEDAFKQAIDVQNIASKLVLQYNNADLTQTFGPIAMFPAGGGIVSSGNLGATGSTSGNPGSISNNGVPAAGARMRFQEPIILRDGVSFAWILNQPEAITLAMGSSAFYSIRVMLFGTSFVEVAE